MKNIFVSFASLSMLALLSAPSTTYAWEDEHSGCRILLCLMNPKGPLSEPKCRPDIRSFYRAVYKGRWYPSCDEAEEKGYKITHAYDHYNLCPSGTVDSRVLKPKAVASGYIATGDRFQEWLTSLTSNQNQWIDVKTSTISIYQNPLSKFGFTRYDPAPGGYWASQGGSGYNPYGTTLKPTSLACIPNGSTVKTYKMCRSSYSRGGYNYGGSYGGDPACVESSILYVVTTPDKAAIPLRKYNYSPYATQVNYQNKPYHRVRYNGNLDDDNQLDDYVQIERQ